MNDLKKLSDSALLQTTKSLVIEERRITTQVLWHLHEIQRRRLYALEGFSSLFEYAVKSLGYSEAAAGRRIAAMRLLAEIPEMEASLESGEVNLSTLSTALYFFKRAPTAKEDKKEILKSLEGKSRRECEQILVALVPEGAPPAERERVVSPTETEIRFVADHRKCKPEKPTEPIQSPPLTPPAELDSNRREPIPAALKREVWRRDGGRCTYRCTRTGRLCGSRFAIQIDHVVPVAFGGQNTPMNLRLLCSAHNRQVALAVFGKEVMRSYLKT